MDERRGVFLSYRRELAFSWTKLVWQALLDADIDAFFDLESAQGAGRFDTRIFNQIEARPYFVPVLAAGSLVRCTSPDDWLRREIEHAVKTRRTIVPLMIQGFEPAEAKAHLPSPVAEALVNADGILLIPEYFDEGVERLIAERLQPTPDTRLVILSDADREFAQAARRRAEATPDPLPPPGPPSPDPTTPPPTPRPPVRGWRSSPRWLRIAVAVGVLAIGVVLLTLTIRRCGTDPTPPDASAAQEPTEQVGLSPDEEMARGTWRDSPGDGEFRLHMQDDGNLTIYPVDDPDDVLFATGTHVTGGERLRMQGIDGNLVIYSDDTSVWSTGTFGHPGAEMRFDADGHMRVVAPDDHVLWSTEVQIPNLVGLGADEARRRLGELDLSMAVEYVVREDGIGDVVAVEEPVGQDVFRSSTVHVQVARRAEEPTTDSVEPTTGTIPAASTSTTVPGPTTSRPPTARPTTTRPAG